MTTWIKEMPVTRVIDYKNSVLVELFSFYSDTLSCLSEVPPGFIFDWESVPVVRGTNKVSGLIHDYFCRTDSFPCVTKKVAADVYLEFMKHSIKDIKGIKRAYLLSKIYTKYWVVRGAWGYFHKKTVLGVNE